ncbi:MAG: HD-GYP domain-containing protein [Defluviitaleaceae bacterium]|nr:HD-GYP domain-containing protein [Defluviitaleaceae bacterium]
MYTHKIKISDAQPGMKLAEPVYIVTNSGTNMLAARKGALLDSALLAMLTKRNVEMLEILSENPPEDVAIAEKQARPVVKNVATSDFELPKAPPEKYAPVESAINDKLKNEAVDSVKELFTCFSEGGINKTTAYQCVNNVESVVNDLLGVLSNDTSGLVHINNLKHFDDYTYHHSLSVSILSMATGRELGLDEDTLFRLGRCAMMHDIGKQLIPIEIINKKGKLTPEEFETVQKHPVLGANSLKQNAVGDVEMWNGIMFHHEKINGTGYPNQLKSKDIPLFSKIISVADVYDAVTSYRSYRTPMLPSEAFDIIVKDAGSSFEYKVIKAFFAKLEIYPVNTIIELNDGRLAIVYESDPNFRLRPAVRLWGSEEVIYLASAANQHLDIVSVINPQDMPPGYEFM